MGHFDENHDHFSFNKIIKQNNLSLIIQMHQISFRSFELRIKRIIFK